MIKLIGLQFKHTWRSWLAALGLFIVTGALTGICLNGIMTFGQEHPDSPHNVATGIFYDPMFFGILTVFIVSSGVIQLVIKGQSQEYSLWAILGANPRQLAFLIGGQLTIIGILGGGIGFLIGFPFTTLLYNWVSSVVTSNQMDVVLLPLSLAFSVKAFALTIGFVGITAGIAGYFHAHRLFKVTKDDLFNFKKPSSKGNRLVQMILILLSGVGLVITYWSSLMVPGQVHHMIAIEGAHRAMRYYVSNLMMIMLLTIIFATLLAPLILPAMIKLLAYVIPNNGFASLNTSYWNSRYHRNYLSSLIAPLFGGAFLLTCTTEIASHITNGGTNGQSAANATLSLVIYLGPPLIIILANVLAISVITGKQQATDYDQLSRLGFSIHQLISEKWLEALIYAGTFLVCGIIGNLPFYLLVKQIGHNLNAQVNIPWFTTTAWPSALFVLILLFLSAVSSFQIFRFNMKNQQAEKLA